MTATPPVRAAVLLVALVAPAGCATPTRAPPAAPPAASPAASPWLAPDHWSAPVLARLHAAGAAGHDPASAERTVADALRLLTEPYAGRLAAEHSWAPAGRPPLVHAEAAALLVRRTGTMRAGGFTTDREWTGPTPESGVAAPGVRLRAESVPARWLAVTAMADARFDAVVLRHGTLDIAAGPIDLWLGRRRVGYAPGDGGGFALNTVDRFDGAGAIVRELPLPVVGRLTAEGFAGPVGRSGLVESPWLIGMRLHARPHRRVDVGVTRGTVFGGIGGARVGVRELAIVLAGANLSGEYADDHVAAVDARWRPPTRSLPVELYGEWGMHDIDFGVLFDMPTFTLGIRLPRLPRLDGVGVALEHTRISESCCLNPPWYHHFELAAGWTLDGAPLGHPLGGHGRQWRLAIAGEARAAAVVFDAAATLRSRGHENLFAPDRDGRAVALEIAADFSLAPRLSARLDLVGERGAGGGGGAGGADWSELRSALAVRWRF